METIKIFQTTGSNTDLLALKEYGCNMVAAYDLWASELIRANRRTRAEQAKLVKMNRADYWGKIEIKNGFSLKDLTHTIYPEGSVSRIRDARYNFKKRFLEATKSLMELEVETEDAYGRMIALSSKYAFEGMDVDEDEDKLYPKFSLSMVQRIKAESIPSPMEVPVVLYRPKRGRRDSVMGFIVNRKLLVHWKMNVKKGEQDTLIPVHSYRAMMDIEAVRKWSTHKTRGRKDGLKMWAERMVKEPVEAYGLFRFGGLFQAGNNEWSIKITRLFD